MNNFQFLCACISSIVALVGASWIVSQALSKGRTETQNFQKEIVDMLSKNVMAITESKKNPDLEKKIEGMQSTISSIQATIAVLQHAHNNMKTGFDGFNHKLDDIMNKIITLAQVRSK